MKKGALVFVIVLALVSTAALAFNFMIASDQELDSDDPNLFLSLGDFLYEKGYAEASISAYIRGLIIDPANARLLNNIGVAYLDFNEVLAEQYFSDAIEKDPLYDIARNNLALLYHKQESYGKAISHLRILLEHMPDHVNYNYDMAINLGSRYYYGGKDYSDLMESLSYYYKVQEIEPGFLATEQNIIVLEEIKALYEGN